MKLRLESLALALIVATMPVLALAELRSGDIMLMSFPCYACRLIEATTHSPFSHAGLIDVDAHGEETVIMAVEPRVTRVSLRQVAAVAKNIHFFRVGAGELGARAAVAATQFLGTPYDGDFVPGPEKLYCAELIYYSYLSVAGNGPRPFQMTPMNFTPYINQWRALLGHAPPQGRPGINPGQIARSGQVHEIFR